MAFSGHFLWSNNCFELSLWSCVSPQQNLSGLLLCSFCELKKKMEVQKVKQLLQPHPTNIGMKHENYSDWPNIKTSGTECCRPRDLGGWPCGQSVWDPQSRARGTHRSKGDSCRGHRPLCTRDLKSDSHHDRKTETSAVPCTVKDKSTHLFHILYSL